MHPSHCHPENVTIKVLIGINNSRLRRIQIRYKFLAAATVSPCSQLTLTMSRQMDPNVAKIRNILIDNIFILEKHDALRQTNERLPADRRFFIRN